MIFKFYFFLFFYSATGLCGSRGGPNFKCGLAWLAACFIAGTSGPERKQKF